METTGKSGNKNRAQKNVVDLSHLKQNISMQLPQTIKQLNNKEPQHDAQKRSSCHNTYEKKKLNIMHRDAVAATIPMEIKKFNMMHRNAAATTKPMDNKEPQHDAQKCSSCHNAYGQ